MESRLEVVLKKAMADARCEGQLRKACDAVLGARAQYESQVGADADELSEDEATFDAVMGWILEGSTEFREIAIWQLGQCFEAYRVAGR